MAAQQTKLNNKVISQAVIAMGNINRELSNLTAEFATVDQLKAPDSYLLGLLRAIQASCSHATTFVTDIDKQVNQVQVQQQVKVE